MRGVSGVKLSGEVDRYCLRLGITKADFSRASGVPAQTVSHLLRAKAPKPETVAALRDFIAAHPDRLPIEPVVRAAVVKPVPVVVKPVEEAKPFKATAGEQVATAFLAAPSDLVRHVATRWPEVWHAVLLRARQDGKTPGATLVALVERGLGIEVTCG